MAIVSFADAGTEDVYNGVASRRARSACPERIWRIARRKLDMIAGAAELRDLRSPPGNRLEELAGDRKGWHSVRINEQYRICFVWTDAGAEQVEITDYH